MRLLYSCVILGVSFIEEAHGSASELAKCQVNSKSDRDEYLKVRTYAEEECYGTPSSSVETTVQVVFVRHAHSLWNKVKKQKTKVFSYAGHAVANTLGFKTNLKDAILTEDGIGQTMALRDWVALETKPTGGKSYVNVPRPTYNENMREFLKSLSTVQTSTQMAGPVNTVVATSNLRRAAITLLIAFANNIKSGALNKVHVLSALQETTTGIDALSHTVQGQRPYLAPGDTCPFDQTLLTDVFDPTCNWGDESGSKERSKGFPRVQRFCRWAANQGEGKTNFVLVGHSSWLQLLYREFYGGAALDMPPKSKLPTLRDLDGTQATAALNLEDLLRTKAQKIKLDNAGVVSFKLKLQPGNAKGCEIVPGSSELVYGGLTFDKKKPDSDTGNAPVPAIDSVASPLVTGDASGSAAPAGTNLDVLV